MVPVNDTSQSIGDPNGVMLATTLSMMLYTEKLKSSHASLKMTTVISSVSNATDAYMRPKGLVNDFQISKLWTTLCVYPGRIYFTVNLRPGEVVTMDGSIWGDSDVYEWISPTSKSESAYIKAKFYHKPRGA